MRRTGTDTGTDKVGAKPVRIMKQNHHTDAKDGPNYLGEKAKIVEPRTAGIGKRTLSTSTWRCTWCLLKPPCRIL